MMTRVKTIPNSAALPLQKPEDVASFSARFILDNFVVPGEVAPSTSDVTPEDREIQATVAKRRVPLGATVEDIRMIKYLSANVDPYFSRLTKCLVDKVSHHSAMVLT